jgi:hypothetical protein
MYILRAKYMILLGLAIIPTSLFGVVEAGGRFEGHEGVLLCGTRSASEDVGRPAIWLRGSHI